MKKDRCLWGLLWLSLLPGRAAGQGAPGLPQRGWEQVWPVRLYGGLSLPQTVYANLLSLGERRYGLTGYTADLDSVGAVRRFHPLLTLVARSSGDSLRSVQYPAVYAAFWGATTTANGTLATTHFWSSNGPGTGADVLMVANFDTLGANRWAHNYPAPAPLLLFGNVVAHPADVPLVALPDGYLAVQNLDNRGPNFYEDAGVLRLDRRGRLRQATYSNANYSDWATEIRPLPDGSYLLTGQTLGFGQNHNTIWGKDQLLVRVRPSGALLSQAGVGIDGEYEDNYSARPTPDGGLVLAGVVSVPNAPVGQRGTGGEVIKLDSTGRVQWRWRLFSTTIGSPTCYFYDAQPTQDGGYVVMGERVEVGPRPSFGDDQKHGLLVKLDGAGQLQWQRAYRPPRPAFTDSSYVGGRFIDWVYEPDGTAVLLGAAGWRDSNNTSRAAHWLLQVTGLPQPWTPAWCARAPAAPQARYQQVSPLGWTFTADSTTGAGPRYGELSLCTWEWGDGTPADTGWVVAHTFTGPDPVRVRQCVTNNLFCQTCTEHFPLGPTGQPAAGAAAVFLGPSVPNPAASEARVAYQCEAAATTAALVVRDLTGRAVLTQALTSSTGEAMLPLRGVPAGVYLYQLVVDGAVRATRRLVVTAY